MILTLLSYAFVAASTLALLFCVALGLQRICTLIENHAAYSRKLGLRLVYASIAIQLGIVLVDSVPLWPLVPSLFAHLLHLGSLSRPTWPFSERNARSSATPTATWWRDRISPLLSLLLPLASHVMLTRHHNVVSYSWHRHRYDHQAKQRLSCGRLDWDVAPTAPTAREMTVLELISVLGVCVWTVPIWRFLGSCAAIEWTLPLGGEASAAPRGVHHGARTEGKSR